MKTKVFLMLFLFSIFTFSNLSAQTVQKGCILGVHVHTINLQPGVTMEEYLDFLINNYIPEYEKNFPGLKLFEMKGIRGEYENKFGLIYVIESEQVRDKYWPQKDVSSDLVIEATKKLEPLLNELRKLGTRTETNQSDWLIL